MPTSSDLIPSSNPTEPTIRALADWPSAVGAEYFGPWMRIDTERHTQFWRGTYLDIAYKGTDCGPEYPPGMVEGFHLLSMLDYMSAELVGTWYGFNYGLNRVRFLSTTTTDDEFRLILKVASVKERGNGYLVNYDAVIEAKGHPRPAMAASWLVLLLPRPSEEGTA